MYETHTVYVPKACDAQIPNYDELVQIQNSVLIYSNLTKKRKVKKVWVPKVKDSNVREKS